MSKLGNFVWGIADQLRGVHKPHQYGGVILPFTILRRLDWNSKTSPTAAGWTPKPFDDQLLRDFFSDPDAMGRAHSRDPDRFRAPIQSDADARDVIALHRRNVVATMQAWLDDDAIFDEAKEATGSPERAWQNLLEANPIVGSLGPLLCDGGGPIDDKVYSFELFRRSLNEPEIVTFDELIAHAEWHVKLAESQTDLEDPGIS